MAYYAVYAVGLDGRLSYRCTLLLSAAVVFSTIAYVWISVITDPVECSVRLGLG
jgi:hypothetical protein